MTNLLKETLSDIKFNGKTPEDILFIGSRDGEYSCTWDEFIVLANIEYDSGYGGQEIASDLVIVFKDNTYMDRYEYDGSESWAYNETPKAKKKTKKITRLTGDSCWVSLRSLNKK